VDESGYIIWEKLKPAHYCGHEYKSKFVAAHQTIEVDVVDKGTVGLREKQN
jgi:hypothetical protein